MPLNSWEEKKKKVNFPDHLHQEDSCWLQSYTFQGLSKLNVSFSFWFFGQIGLKVLKMSAILLNYPIYFVMSAQKMIKTFGFKLYSLCQNRLNRWNQLSCQRIYSICMFLGYITWLNLAFLKNLKMHLNAQVLSVNSGMFFDIFKGWLFKEVVLVRSSNFGASQEVASVEPE